MTYDKFWRVYLQLRNLHDDNSVFVDIIKGYLRVDGDNFVEPIRELCRSQDSNTITAVVELLSRIYDIRVLSVMEDLIDTAAENNKTPAATSSSIAVNNYLQTVVSSTVTYIDNYLKSDSFDECNKSRCKQVLQKAARVCTNTETFRTITEILFDTSIHTVTNIDAGTQPSSSSSNQTASSWNFTASSIKDLNWERVKQLTSPVTSYDAIKCFTENARTGIHPCVVGEIVLKWWRVRTDGEHVDMSFITPLIKTIENVSTEWYYNVCEDERYKGLTETLDIPKPEEERVMCYMGRAAYNNINLRDCIRKGDGTPVQLKCFKCTYSMERYRQSVPAFRYNTAVFPPCGDTIHHWYVIILITQVIFYCVSYLYLTLYNNSVYISNIFCIYVRYTFQ